MRLISLKELNSHNYPTTLEIDANLLDLLIKINRIRAAYGVPLYVTSGLRSEEQQKELIAAGKSSAPKSHHLIGQAVDIADTAGLLAHFVQDNLKLMENVGLWIEDFKHTRGWVHFQTVPPKSGNRVFIP